MKLRGVKFMSYNSKSFEILIIFLYNEKEVYF